MPPKTTTRHEVQPVPRLALSPDEAAAALGVSRDHFDGHILPELRVVRRGRRKLIPVAEIERWLQRAASVSMATELARPVAASRDQS